MDARLKEDGCPGSSPGMTTVGAECELTEVRQKLLPLRPALQRLADLVQHLGVLYGRGHGPGFTVGDLLDGAAQDLAGTGFRQAADGDRELEGRHGSELFTHQRHY